ncbi:hypothetical protein C4588_01860 [Candidatus Parcubacteria bacterium]|nr:MAG: hypothetical protein C4588_01860 [Candidatus Parcubacteria bacterium]
MPNKIIFKIAEDTIDIDRDFLENWYRETNPYDYPYDHLKHELSKTSIKDLAELYIDIELAEGGLTVTYEIFRDPSDKDVADNLKSEMRYIFGNLRWMLPPEEVSGFIDELQNY